MVFLDNCATRPPQRIESPAESNFLQLNNAAIPHVQDNI